MRVYYSKLNLMALMVPCTFSLKIFLLGGFSVSVEMGKPEPWQHVSAGAPQGSVLGPLFFLVYINDLSESVASQVKLCADDTSIFQIISDVNLSWQSLSNDLSIIQDYRWKMSSTLIHPNKHRK